jgi:hypothetical protein
MQGIAMRVAAATALVLSVSSAEALEPFKVYDKFSERPLDPARWAEGERVREIRGAGVLRLMQRSYGLGESDSGLQFQSWSSSLANPNSVTSLRARVNVTALETQACPSNPALSQARARISGTFFNIGTPIPGSLLNDVFAQVRLGRVSTSPDPEGVLRVQGVVVLCTTSDCNFASTIGSVELGTVALGTPTVVQMQWDQGGKTFFFSRDNGAFSGAVSYGNLPDTSPPGAPAKQLSTRVDLPNCQSAPPVSSLVDVKFDNVQVNQGALP